MSSGQKANSIQNSHLSRFVEKLRRRKINLRTLVQRCEAIDKNNDDWIHISDLEEILIDYLGCDNISRREIELLMEISSSTGNGNINYREVFSTVNKMFNRSYCAVEDEVNRWYEPLELKHQSKGNKTGSLGSWLDSESCPLERHNLHRFMGCIEEFERMSGIRAVNTGDGLIVALGPNLKAKIYFCTDP
jgi:hypothetical protein